MFTVCVCVCVVGQHVSETAAKHTQKAQRSLGEFLRKRAIKAAVSRNEAAEANIFLRQVGDGGKYQLKDRRQPTYDKCRQSGLRREKPLRARQNNIYRCLLKTYCTSCFVYYDARDVHGKGLVVVLRCLASGSGQRQRCARRADTLQRKFPHSTR